MSRYAISDIHGCAKTFRYLVEEKIKLKPTDQLFLLGDYIDRGPDSKGVLDFILALRAQDYAVTTLIGNHEYMLLQALEDPEHRQLWLLNGGRATLNSFNAHLPAVIVANYWPFFSALEYYQALDDYLLVHAGFDFTAPNPFADYEDMLWTRKFTPDEKYTQGRLVVHGHTPTVAPKITAQLGPPVAPALNIDGGCVYQRPSLGQLVALNLDTRELLMVENRE